MYQLFMSFENPTEAFSGKKQTVQGFAVYGDEGFILYHTGVCAVYDLRARDSAPRAVFRLGSYNEGTPDNRYTNHANDAMFGAVRAGEQYPLLYVTAGNSGDCDEKGYIAYCAVEQIRQREGVFTSETVQRIYYRDDGAEQTSFCSPGWGWPASLVDVEGGWYYMLSARYRTKRSLYRPDNAYIVTKFRLPAPDVPEIFLTPADIVDQFALPFEAFFTQGGTVRDGKIYYMFGCGNEDHPNRMNVIDLAKKDYALCEDLSGESFHAEEVECCAFYGDRLLINAQGGHIYERI